MFITFEGIEGSGKTTQIKKAAGVVESFGKSVILTREPGATGIGSKIRAILLDPESAGLTSDAELLLYMADRAQHIQTIIKPALESGKTVLCDRYFDATLAYQGYARGLDTDHLKKLHRILFDDFKPDLTLLLDLEPEQGLARAKKALDSGSRDVSESRFENEIMEFHKKVRSGYLDIAKNEPERFKIVRADQSESVVFLEIQRILSQVFK